MLSLVLDGHHLGHPQGINLGATGLGAASCTPSYCSGTGTTDTLYRRLQKLTNDAAKKVGLGGTIAVDGKIGAATARRIYDVSAAMPSRPDLVLLMTFDSGTTFKWTADHAPKLVEELEALMTGDILMPVDSDLPAGVPRPHWWGSIPGTITTVTQTPTTAPGTSTTTTFPVGGLSPLGKLAIAGGAILILGGTLLAVRRRRRPPAPVPMAGHRRRR